MRRIAPTVVAAALLAGPASATLTAGDQSRSLVWDGATRAYDMHVPPGYDGSTRFPLVFDFHGLTSNKDQQEALSGFKALADTAGFVVVFPDGLFGSFNGGDLCCGRAVTTNVDDVGFVRAMVRATAAEGRIDLRRVYATGLSNGGAMSHRLACEASDVFAAVAPVSFPLPFTPFTKCAPARPVPLIQFAGLTDTVIPYEGGGAFRVPPEADSFAFWRDADGCGADALESTVVAGGSRCETDTSCADGVEVALCSVVGSAATFFPGHFLYLNDDIDLPAVAWAFLSRFTLPCGDADRAVCDEQLLSLHCEGSTLPRGLRRLVQKQVADARRTFARAARAAEHGRAPRAADLRRQAVGHLRQISMKSAAAVDHGRISERCGAAIADLVGSIRS